MAQAAGFQTLSLHTFPSQAHRPVAGTGICCSLSRAGRSLGNAQGLGGRGSSACGAQRHWLKDISGFGVGLLCPSLFLPFTLLMLSGKEDLAWHALSLSWQLPPREQRRLSRASAVLGQLQPSLFLCRTELSPPTSFPLWCCLPPIPLCNTRPSAATLAFIAAWLGLPSPFL